jgi:hypothetical protein
LWLSRDKLQKEEKGNQVKKNNNWVKNYRIQAILRQKNIRKYVWEELESLNYEVIFMYIEDIKNKNM